MRTHPNTVRPQQSARARLGAKGKWTNIYEFIKLGSHSADFAPAVDL